MQYKEDEEEENFSEPESNAYQDDFHMHHMPSHKDVAYIHPTFPGKGQLILGQEQEILCGGFDDTDSLSADIFGFEVFSISLLNNVDVTNSKIYALCRYLIYLMLLI